MLFVFSTVNIEWFYLLIDKTAVIVMIIVSLIGWLSRELL